MSQYKVIAMDLDGTLTNSQKVITPRTHAALMNASKMGVKLLLASGRPTVGIMALAHQLGLARSGGYVLSYNGAQILNCTTGEVPVATWFNRGFVPSVCRFAAKHGITVLSYDDRGVVTEHPDDPYVAEEARINGIPVNQVESLVEYLNFPMNKLLLVGDPDKLAAVEPLMKKKYQGRLNVYRSQPFFLEVVPLGVDKAASLKLLLDKMGLTPAELMTFGDGWNDKSMIELAGMGVAMGNAVDEVKAVANYITDDNDHDGVGKAVEKFVLNQ